VEGASGGEARGLRLGVELAQVGDGLAAQLVEERGRGGVHTQIDPARVEGELPELGEQHRLAGAAGAGDEDRPRLGDVAGQGRGELVDREVAAGEDHRGEAEPGGEGVAGRRPGVIVPCVSVYVKGAGTRGEAWRGAGPTDDSSAFSKRTNPPLEYPREFLSSFHRCRTQPSRCRTPRPPASSSGAPDTPDDSHRDAVMTSRHALPRGPDARRHPSTPPPPSPDRSSTHHRYPHLLPHFVARLS